MVHCQFIKMINLDFCSLRCIKNKTKCWQGIHLLSHIYCSILWRYSLMMSKNLLKILLCYVLPGTLVLVKQCHGQLCVSTRMQSRFIDWHFSEKKKKKLGKRIINLRSEPHRKWNDQMTLSKELLQIKMIEECIIYYILLFKYSFCHRPIPLPKFSISNSLFT